MLWQGLMRSASKVHKLRNLLCICSQHSLISGCLAVLWRYKHKQGVYSKVLHRCMIRAGCIQQKHCDTLYTTGACDKVHHPPLQIA